MLSPWKMFYFGIKPIGTVTSSVDWSHLQNKLEGVENIGVVGEPNLEKVLASPAT